MSSAMETDHEGTDHPHESRVWNLGMQQWVCTWLATCYRQEKLRAERLRSVAHSKTSLPNDHAESPVNSASKIPTSPDSVREHASGLGFDTIVLPLLA